MKWFNSWLRIVIEADILDKVLGVYLNQDYKGWLYLVTLYSKKLSPTELNYDIYNKKLLAIVNTFK